ncbi:MAG: primosomal protein N' [Clostridiales bacterium]|nr:primosomal protein N' [Clostridiales bacterium]
MSYQKYADIIIDISHENLDKTYQYTIPKEFFASAIIGALVVVPFGRGSRKINGYIVGLSNEPKIDIDRIKPIDHVVEDAPVIESHLIYLAHWIKETFGGTMNDALKTVMPIKKAVKIKEKRRIVSIKPYEELSLLYEEQKRKNNAARIRILEALLKNSYLDYDDVTKKLKISKPTITWLETNDVIKIESKQIYRNPIEKQDISYTPVTLSDEQEHIVENILRDYNEGIRNTYLIHGVTGSGKTEVYMEVISAVVASGKQVIVLIPEIALTYQTVNRFYSRFGDRISILNSRMSDGERYDQGLRAKNGEIDIMIGPRSALFTPFQNLGLIIIDEEHEGSYKSEATPKYHAIEVAKTRAKLTGAFVILGSATPSMESYYSATKGEYKLFHLSKRAKEASQPKIWVVDLREELRQKNRSIFSRKLKELIEDRLNKQEQIMLFINRRGYAGFVSCRSCGYVIKCSRCDVSMTSHVQGGYSRGKLLCHYCGSQEPMPNTCPVCGSKYIAAFGTGTQKIEEMVKREFPKARVLRMDADTTKNKGDHQKILSAFAHHKADILVGTQMIVKGHDFPLVTLVGIVAADLSLYAGDFRAGERTFQLLSQAAGRAGRDRIPGEVVIQTYNPEHYSIVTAAEGDYQSFYEQEMLYRSLMQYPPASHIMVILITAREEDLADKAIDHAGLVLKDYINTKQLSSKIIGPAPAGLAKVKDTYRRVIYIKEANYNYLVELKNYFEGYFNYSIQFAGCSLQVDFNPMSTY